MTPEDDFYIGYGGPPSPSTARVVRRVVAAATCAGLTVGALAILWQHPFAASRFAFGNPSRAEGRLVADPYPALVHEGRRMWLVAPGKHGADALVASHVGQFVQLDGALIERDESRMLEIVTGSIAARPDAPTAARAPSIDPFGRVTLRGEIVDSKCFLGVMNPGERTVHRECAIRCISGGVPPMLVVRDGTDRERHIMLVSRQGDAIGPELLELVARPVEVTGELERRDGTWYLRADAPAFQLIAAR